MTARRKGGKVDGEKEKRSGLLAQIIFRFAHSNHRRCPLRSLRSVVCQNFLHQHKTFQKCLSFLPLDMIKCFFFPGWVKKKCCLCIKSGSSIRELQQRLMTNNGQWTQDKEWHTRRLSLYVFLSLFPLFFLILSIAVFHFCKWVILWNWCLFKFDKKISFFFFLMCILFLLKHSIRQIMCLRLLKLNTNTLY